ncbi:Ribosome biogenesis protein BRX1 [Ceratocystis fimbriata CBS 114723]|uniref:Ribosome biogenesis protein BRX1 n=2 Tax=Ceratocystis TaxID=5157 RepID=A0A0F8BKW2_CERFI|nr:Ribosome biogenesis protein BRX1 [Ceratocystis platani]PHH52315.1 Ribosome biogenesis protein BRX1 [Ceratocystis fimbriata CBS 114723]
MAAVYKSIAKANGTEGKPEVSSTGPRKNKQRVLVLSSRGVTYRHRHLLNDLAQMMPHARKDVKFDSKSKLYQLNELAELYNCNNVFFFEARKAKDLYCWFSKIPNGPTVKMHIQSLYTMEELRFTGNCLKGSRPILSFDSAFENEPHLRLIRELMFHTFGVPEGARKSKPFVDHVMGFSYVDGKIWVRTYQINEIEAGKLAADGAEETVKKTTKKHTGMPGLNTDVQLVEIGPRFVMTPIIIQEGSFGGPIIYENKEFVSPNQVRSDLRKARSAKHNTRIDKAQERQSKKKDLGLRSDGPAQKKDALDKRELFA